MTNKTTARSIAALHKLKSVSKIVVKKNGEQLLNKKPKKIITL